MNEKISIIIPVYNVERYIEECLDSVINQTYKNLEILIINDGSTDRSLEICRKYKKKDKRIRLINQKNMGVAYCRNLGLKKVTSAYVMFVDSDDYIEENMVATLYKLLKSNNSDIAMCAFKNILDFSYESNLINDSSFSFDTCVLEGEKKFQFLYDKNVDMKLCSVVIWNKLYKKDIFKNIKYPDNTIHEDEAMAHVILNRANKIVFTSKKLYNYRKRENSITNSPYSEERQDILPALLKRYHFFKKNNYNMLASNTLKSYCFFIMKHYKYSMNYGILYKVKNKLRKNLKDIMKDLILDKYISLLTKLMIICFYFMPKFVLKVVFYNKELTL